MLCGASKVQFPTRNSRILLQAGNGLAKELSFLRGMKAPLFPALGKRSAQLASGLPLCLITQEVQTPALTLFLPNPLKE